MKILIVDDNDANLYMLNCLLTGHGNVVVEANNGEEALIRLHSEEFNLIISDILMPVMDGFTLCREVKKDKKLQALPFIIYTATYTGPKDEAFALEIGASKFILKPCDPVVFIKAVNEVVDNYKNNDYFTPLTEENEEDILKLYNERLVRKLEQKMLQSEQEVMARHEIEEALRRSEWLLNATQKISKIGGWAWDIEHKKTYWTEETYRIYDIDPNELSYPDQELYNISLQGYEKEDREKIDKAFHKCIANGTPYEFECPFITTKGRKLFIKTAGQPVYEDNLLTKINGYIQDFTEIKQNELERDKLKEQLLQSQKLDSIGQLAGGIAHDFNNILNVILIYCEVVMNSLPKHSDIYSDIEEITKAGQRASDLTRQLLIFSRKHIAQPQIIDLNNVINDLKKMLVRIIGEQIDFITSLSDNLGLVKIDQGHIEQIIMNLVINARDAMPSGGKLIIETSTILIDSDLAENHISMPLGQYAVLIISDSGCGMNKETKDRIFEPFFTTKEKGKGTGLGLSTVYGIVKEAGGSIWVYSEINKGTTFKIFFPITNEQAVDQNEKKTEDDLFGNNEKILLIEDDPALRTIFEKMIKKQGYCVTSASSGEEALEAVEIQGFTPDLLISDVVIPGIYGIELVKRLKATVPNLKLLFMSGHTDSAIVLREVLDVGIPFIQKPFTCKVLASLIKKLLQQDTP